MISATEHDDDTLSQGGPADEAADTAWHYTDTAGFLGIVENHTLRATHYRYMNDGLECRSFDEAFLAAVRRVGGSAGEDKLRPVLARIKPQDNLFLLCASSLRDNLTAWRGYGHGTSFSIGLNTSKSLAVLDPMSDTSAEPVEVLSHWWLVDYGGSREWMEHIALNSLSIIDLDDGESTLTESLNLWRATFKHPGFEDEREVRVAVCNNWGDTWSARPHKLGVAPYINLTGHRGKHRPWIQGFQRVKDPSPLPITDVLVSPGAGDEAVHGALHVLRQAGYVNSAVLKSETPFR